MSFEDEIREKRQLVSQKQAERVRAQTELDAAERRLAEARKTLRDDFGVATTEEAKAMQAKLQAELAQVEADIEKAFAEAGA